MDHFKWKIFSLLFSLQCISQFCMYNQFLGSCNLDLLINCFPRIMIWLVGHSFLVSPIKTFSSLKIITLDKCFFDKRSL